MQTAPTGSWVVDEDHAARGMKMGSYVALHQTKSEPSYRQGIIKDWRKDKDNGRIWFLLEPTQEPYLWVGSGAGEKGYYWSGD